MWSWKRTNDNYLFSFIPLTFLKVKVESTYKNSMVTPSKWPSGGDGTQVLLKFKEDLKVF